MKALTLWQPWASLWLTPAKVHETRPWKTSYRGELAVHAAKRPIDGYLPIELRGLCIDHFGRNWRDTLPLGAIIGVVQLVDCYSSNDHDPAHWEDARCGDFSAGRYLWKRGLTLTLARPLPAVGKQRLWNGPEVILGAPEPKADADVLDHPCPHCGHRFGDHKAVVGWIGKGCPTETPGEPK